MTFPTIETTATSAAEAVSSLAVTMPSGIATGDLLIMIVGCRQAAVNTVTGWTSFADSGGTATDQRAFWREADETEGASVSVGLSTSSNASAAAYRISGAADPGTRPPEGLAAYADVDEANPDSPSLTPTGGAKDYYWISSSFQRTNYTVTLYPTNYSLNQLTAQGVAASVSNRSGYAGRKINASSENPGSFTYSGIGDWSAITVAVHPVGSSQSIVPIILNLTEPESGGTI